MFFKAFINRCILKYNLAFLQWRSTKSKADFVELEKLFQKDHSLLSETMKKTITSVKNNKKNEGESENKTQPVTVESDSFVSARIRPADREALSRRKKKNAFVMFT